MWRAGSSHPLGGEVGTRGWRARDRTSLEEGAWASQSCRGRFRSFALVAARSGPLSAGSRGGRNAETVFLTSPRGLLRPADGGCFGDVSRCYRLLLHGLLHLWVPLSAPHVQRGTSVACKYTARP